MIKHINYWNSFVLNWVSSPSGPSNVYNSGYGDLSSQYVPEPWWGVGYDESNPSVLYSVCMNLNPGEADPALQTLNGNPAIKGIKQYSDLFSMLPKTSNWHYKKRALPIGNALKTISGIPAGSLDHHLSVELIPWHTKHATNQYGFWNYVSANTKDVFDHSFLFAADSSRYVTGKLNKVVLLRFSEASALQLFDLFNLSGLACKPVVNPITGFSNPNVHATEFTFPSTQTIADIRFVAIWRSKGFRLNDFPADSDMNEIISKI